MGRTSDARERLIDTALTLIRARSYGAVSVDDLCRHADVRKGSFYHFFRSKRDLALAALEAGWARTEAEVLLPAVRAEGSALARVRTVFLRAGRQQARMQAHAGHVLGCPFGNLTMELSAQDDAVRTALEDIFARFAGYFRGLLDEAVAAGELPPQDTEAGARALLAYLYGTILLAKTANDAAVMERLADQALRLVQGAPAGPVSPDPALRPDA